MADIGFKVLIVEDDVALGQTLREALTRKGHIVLHVPKPDEALQLLQRQSFDYLMIDCLLPQMTGVDLAKKIRNEVPQAENAQIILMSGIYTDQSFQQESVNETKAIGFLKKPFQLEQLDQYIKIPESTKSQTPESPRKQLYEIFEKEKVSSREKRRLIESLEEVDGYDLPFIYSLLAETKTSGHLNIFSTNGSVSGVTFCQGNIVGVDVEDQTTILGHMLVQSGYLHPEDLAQILNDKSPRKIGTKLIESSKLSPHAFDMILNEQMNIRLSKTIVDGKIKVNFVATEVEPITPAIDSDLLLEFLHDWVASKIPLAWLESLYLMWSGQKILKSSQWKDDHPVFQTSFVKRVEHLAKSLNDGMTLNDLLSAEAYDSVSIYKAVHLLLLKGLIVFSPEKMQLDPNTQKQHIKKLHTQIVAKETHQVLDLFHDLLVDKPDTSWLDELIKFMGPAPQDQEVYKMWSAIKDKFERALKIHWTSDLDESTVIRKKQQSQKQIQAMQILEDIKSQLQLNQYTKAQERFDELEKLHVNIPGVRLCKCWIQLGQLDASKRQFQLKEIELELMQVPPDEKYDALYPFVYGLYLKAKGDLTGAKKSFEKSQAIDMTFVPTKRELALIVTAAKAQPKQDIFNRDLKDVVSGFFKKKAG